MKNAIANLSPSNGKKNQWHVIIETPKASHIKFKYDEKHGLFMLHNILPEGMSFPYDFGFLPATLGADGDPLDVLLLAAQPTFSGCLVNSRLIGVIEAQQKERDGTKERNDRLVAVTIKDRQYEGVKSVKDIDSNIIGEVEHFFVSYNQVFGRSFKVIALHGPKKALALAHQGMRNVRNHKA